MNVTKSNEVTNQQQHTQFIAAILFTDIEGFSARSNTDPESALWMAQKHREVLESSVAQYQGECINFYGDGSLSTFQTTADAVQCAIAIQKAFNHTNTIPVRVGVHIGEVTRDEHSVYGDAVNIASRIQSISSVGGILVSEAVKNMTPTNSLYSFEHYGSETLKNIPHPMTLYAVNAEGVLPINPIIVHKQAITQSNKKSRIRWVPIVLFLVLLVVSGWSAFFSSITRNEITEEVYQAKLAVLPFENMTGNPADSMIGHLAAQQIITGLKSIPGTHIVTSDFLNAYIPIDHAGFFENTKVPKLTRAKNVILGEVHRSADSIILKANLINIQSNEILYSFSNQSSTYENSFLAIKKMEGQIRGYWLSKDENFYKVPNDRAYQYYIAAMEQIGVNDSMALSLLEKSIHADSSFLDAYMLKFDLFYNLDMGTELRSWNNLIEAKFPVDQLNDRQRRMINFNRSDINGENIKAYQFFIPEYEADKEDIFQNQFMAVLALEYVNHPQKAIEVLSKIDPSEIDFFGCIYCRTRIDLMARAFIDLGMYQSAIDIFDHYPKPLEEIRSNQTLIRAYIGLKDTLALMQHLTEVKYYLSEYQVALLHYYGAKDAMIMGHSELGKQLGQVALDYFKDEKYSLTTRLYLLMDRPEQAYENSLYLFETYGKLSDQIFMGVSLAKLERTEEANAILDEMLSTDDTDDIATDEYNLAYLQCALGNFDEALQSLRKSISAGKKFARNRFQWDHSLGELHQHDGFNRLIHPLQT